MKTKRWLVWAAALGALSCVQARVFSLHDEMVRLGLKPADYLTATANAAGSIGNLFDGVKQSTSGGRWIVTRGNAFASIRVPAELADCRIIGYRIWRLTMGQNELNRSPSANELYGVTESGATNLLSSVSGIKWLGPIPEAQAHETWNLDLHGVTHYKEFVYKPTQSDNGGASNNIGIMELEIIMSDDVSDFAQYANINIPAFGNKYVNLTVEPASSFEHVYKVGTQVTVTAPEQYAGLDFHEWFGNGIADGTGRSMQITVGSVVGALPLYNGMWLFQKDSPSRRNDYATATIAEIGEREDGSNWKFNVANLSNADRMFSLGLASATDGSMIYEENGAIVGSGRCDLSTPVIASDGIAWKAHSFLNGSQFAKEGIQITEIIAPKTLQTFSAAGQTFNKLPSGTMTNLVMDCPEMSGSFGTWDFPVTGRLVLKCPKITSITGRAFGDGNGALRGTDVSEWDLSGVTELKAFYKNDVLTSGAFGKVACRGVLRLPNVKNVGPLAFYNANNLDGVVLGGDDCTLESVAADAFSGTCAIKMLEMNGAKGWTLSRNSIALGQNLTEIVFRGSVPTIVGEGNGVWINGDTAAKTVGFFVPNRDPEWERLFAGMADEAAAGDVTAWSAANPSAFGKPRLEIAPSVFGTQHPQLLGYSSFPKERHGWIYTPEAKTISDGVWTLNVYEANAGEKRLGLGKGASLNEVGNAYTGVGGGALDLNGPMVNADNSGEVWTLTDFGRHCLSRENLSAEQRAQNVVTELYLPEGTLNFGASKIMYSDTEVTTLRKLWISMPEVSDVGPQAFQGHKIAQAWINLPKAASVQNRAFQDIVNIHGKLVLGRVTYLGNNNFNDTGLDEAEIGLNLDPKENTVLSDGNSPSFINCMANNPGLKKLTFGPYSDMQFTTDTPFVGNTGYEEVVFQWKPVATQSIDRILISCANIADGGKVVIKCSKRLGWETMATAPTAQELAQGYPEGVIPERVLGIYQGANGKRNAWVVDYISSFDPKGTCVIIR